MAYHLLTGASPFSDLIGVAAGHTYIYFKMVLPESHGYDLLKTPKWVESMVDKINSWFEEPVQRRRLNILNNQGGQADVQAVNAEGNPLNRMPRNARDEGPAFRAFAGRGVRIGGE